MTGGIDGKDGGALEIDHTVTYSINGRAVAHVKAIGLTAVVQQPLPVAGGHALQALDEPAHIIGAAKFPGV